MRWYSTTPPARDKTRKSCESGMPGRCATLSPENGTFLNGARVAEAPLSVGDRVLCGNTSLTYDGRRLISDDARGAS